MISWCWLSIIYLVVRRLLDALAMVVRREMSSAAA
jgi:hypothetical protein